MIKGDFAICALSVIPVRAEAKDTAEIVTQLLFGELAEIIAIDKQWFKIKIFHDNYEGWIDHKQLLEIKNKDLDALKKIVLSKRQQTEIQIKTPWGYIYTLEGSPRLFLEKEIINQTLNFNYTEIPIKESKDIAEIGLKYLNSPYLWGGRTRYGIDCSGFTQTVFHQLGINLNRDASQQYRQGEEIQFKDKKEGDLAFFKSAISGKITHVGIILKDRKIIHAHGRVRIDLLDEKGIYNETEKYYSHKLEGIKRMIKN